MFSFDSRFVIASLLIVYGVWFMVPISIGNHPSNRSFARQIVAGIWVVGNILAPRLVAEWMRCNPDRIDADALGTINGNMFGSLETIILVFGPVLAGIFFFQGVFMLCANLNHPQHISSFLSPIVFLGLAAAFLQCRMRVVLSLEFTTTSAAPTDENVDNEMGDCYLEIDPSDESFGRTPECSDSSIVSNQRTDCDPEDSIPGAANQCTLYIAESTIPNAGLGIFTTKPYNVNQPIGNPDLCLPYVLSDWKYSFTLSMDDYAWQGHAMGMQREAFRTSALCPGLGSLVNCHIPLINPCRGLPRYDPLSTNHPSSGAISPYAHVTPVAVRNIPVG